MAKYKVGDKVRARSDLKANKKYGSLYLNHGMYRELKTKRTFTISEIASEGNYFVEESLYIYSEEMFEGLAEQEFHVFDTVKHRIYGIGTVIEIIDDTHCRVDFDEKPYDRPNLKDNVLRCCRTNLTLIQAYSPN